ncbi:MAG: acriflavin resistance protein [Gammaproteobacteria bacterium RIFCSPLOWO2_02_FULL_47_50]|nr:MAG: acriflavin resistance protein [Gammaproteobacteria bacterium RIFCSPLOWO2_02_47_7]OGT65457.1 MAG: acriflavin resistance protein [Gammaproteobacteria bacterium RIFCSPLOWO2_01_FULL_47_190]OGT73340.1 MAG: acriflavin resistance protein [Gammaproteobacteria bacterium RIFCSPLOWO2_12_47_11]OGT81108.1 MAG: acriflavin resistance protein [Gammaproteobacteria bacterium RIFCSPLOWO2_02_FULL_47_50]OGT85381.1 MAG: acriflavin resistance protein [Gammaproteobacteria bacterium RIFCSPLOWO2_12_FULL_47_76]
MLAAIVRFSIRFRGVIITLACLLIAYGIYEIPRAGLDIFPEFSPKLVIIQTESPGLSTEQVEILVTQQIENAIGGLINLHHIRSESIQGLSIVNVVFDEKSDVYRNRQLVSERLAGINSRLPEGVHQPVIVPLASSSATVLTIGITSDSHSLMELREIADWTIVPRLLSVPGIADVNVFGGDIRQLQIQVDPEKLKVYGASIHDVVTVAGQATAIKGSGFIENRNQRITLTTAGQPSDEESIGNVILKRHQGSNVYLKDVAEIKMGAEPPFSAAAMMGKRGIVMMVIGQYGANTLTVSRAAENALNEFKVLFEKQDINLYPDLFRPANYIEVSLKNISGHLMVGGLFVVIILVLFLFNLKTAFISALAIPLSLISATLVLLNMGINLNVMVLGGLAIVLGEVVDDAIIDTENIFRRLRQNRLLEQPRPVAEVVFDASMEVRSSVVYATFIVAIVFIPLLTLSGLAGRLFSPLGFSYILAILMSLVVALTVTPALCYFLLERGKLSSADPPLIRLIKPVYSWLLHLIGRFPMLTISVSIIVCFLSFGIVPRLGGEFLPDLREGHYIVHTSSLPGTSLQESIRMGNELTREFLKITGVRSISQWAGRAERGADTFGSHYSEFEVDLVPMSGSEQQRVLDQLRGVMRSMPGILFEAHNFLSERIDETISGYQAPVVINIYGEDLEVLDRLVQAVAEVTRSVPGGTDIQLRSPPGTPLLQIRLNLEQLASWGLRPVEVMDAIRVAYEGHKAGRINKGNRIYDVAVFLKDEQRQQPLDVNKLPLRTMDGVFVTLDQVADIAQTGGRYNILHRGAQRVQTVTTHVENRDLESFMDELKERVLEEIRFPAGTYPEFTGASIERAKAREELILHSTLAGIGVLILIFIAVGNSRNVLLMLLNLPFSLVGGILAVLVTGNTISVGSMVGFVTLFGITVRNSIMLVSHYKYLIEVEGLVWNMETAIKGAQERLPSILMTALVTALAMLPIAFDSDNPGREIMGPMASIIIGGLASSTLMNLLIMPTIMLNFGSFKKQ